MPMIDVYAADGTFADKHTLAQNLAQAVMRWEQVPKIPLFSDNTAAFIHDLPSEAIANAAGGSGYVRVQVLTPVGVLDREQADIVRDFKQAWEAKDIEALIGLLDPDATVIAGGGDSSAPCSARSKAARRSRTTASTSPTGHPT
jgi:hypothetical protein